MSWRFVITCRFLLCGVVFLGLVLCVYVVGVGYCCFVVVVVVVCVCVCVCSSQETINVVIIY